MSTAKYPLEQLVQIKKKRLEEAEKVLKQKKEQLAKEEEKQKKLEEKRRETLSHKEDKLMQLREEMDAVTTSDKIRGAHAYIKVVDQELKQREERVKQQTHVVKKALGEVDMARRDFVKKQQDIEKLRLHRKEWDKEMKALEERQMTLETDELGASMHNIRKFKKRG